MAYLCNMYYWIINQCVIFITIASQAKPKMRREWVEEEFHLECLARYLKARALENLRALARRFTSARVITTSASRPHEQE